MNNFPKFEQGELPIQVTFSVAYLDGVMEDEHPEIAKQWAVIRNYVQSSARAKDQPA